MWRIADFVLILILSVALLAGLAGSAYALYWTYQKVGLWLILLGPLIMPLPILAALVATLPISAPLMVFLKNKPGSMFYED